MNFKVLIPFVLGVIFIIACKEKNTFTVEQNKVTVKQGTEFTLKIEANHSTGYKWMEQTTIDTNFLLLKLIDYEVTNKNVDGGGGYEYWHFKALKEGETEVKLKYVRPWENDPPVKTVAFTIIVN